MGVAEELTAEDVPKRRRADEAITPETIEAAVQRVLDRRNPPGAAVQAGVDRVEELTLAHLADAFGKAQSVLSSRVDELVRAAVGPALASALTPIQEELAGLKDGVKDAKTAAADTRAELESKMKMAEAATAAIGADLAVNSKKTEDTAALIQTLLDDQRAQREKREQQEEADREKQQAKDALDFQIAGQRADRLEWLVKWGMGVIATLVVGVMVVQVETWVQRSGSLTPQVGIGMALAGVVLMVLLGLWVRIGFGLNPQPPPRPVHPPTQGGGHAP